MKVKFIDTVSLVIKGVTYNPGAIVEISEEIYKLFSPAFEVVESVKVAVEPVKEAVVTKTTKTK